MSDPITQFSFQVEHPDGAKLVAEMLTEYERMQDLDFEVESPIFGDDPECGIPAFSLDDGAIWIRDDGGESSVDIAAAMAQWVLNQPGADDDPIAFEWSSGCTKPLLDAFGGGACVVTKDTMRFRYTGLVVGDLLDELAGLPNCLVESSGGVAEVTHGRVLLIDWDEVPNDAEYAAKAKADLQAARLPSDEVARCVNVIDEVWPDA